jgi:hypothetical protein
MRQRGREPPGRSRRQGRRVLRPRGSFPGGGWRDSARHSVGHRGPRASGGGRALPETIHDFRVDLIVTRMRPSGAPSRIGHQASSGSIWIKTRLLKFQRWRPHQLGAGTQDIQPRGPLSHHSHLQSRPAASGTCNHLGCGQSTPGAGAETVSGACRCPQPRPQEPAYPVESARKSGKVGCFACR